MEVKIHIDGFGSARERDGVLSEYLSLSKLGNPERQCTDKDHLHKNV